MQEKKKLAIEVDNVQKIYKLYDKPSDRMKEAFALYFHELIACYKLLFEQTI